MADQENTLKAITSEHNKALVRAYQCVAIFYDTKIFWHIAPKSLTLAEGHWGAFSPLWSPLASFLGPLAPFGGLWPLPVSPMNFSAQVHAF